MITYRQNTDKLAELQQSKYLDLYTILPSEISMQLAEVSLALGAIEDQVLWPGRGNCFKLNLHCRSTNVAFFLICSRFFQKREKFKEQKRSTKTLALESMTFLKNSKQFLLNSRKNLPMLIMPKKRSRLVFKHRCFGVIYG